MNIQNSQAEDINMIFDLYRIATDIQKSKSVVPWPDFDRALIRKEINAIAIKAPERIMANRYRPMKSKLDSLMRFRICGAFIDSELMKQT